MTAYLVQLVITALKVRIVYRIIIEISYVQCIYVQWTLRPVCIIYTRASSKQFTYLIPLGMYYVQTYASILSTNVRMFFCVCCKRTYVHLYSKCLHMFVLKYSNRTVISYVNNWIMLYMCTVCTLV